MTSSERPLAVVTGASSGIGFELAKVFGENGYELLIVAEDNELHPAQEELKGTGATVRAHRVDLASESGVVELYEQISREGRPVDSLALNGGVGAGGAFATETRLREELRMVDLNVRSVVHLCKLVLADMVERGHGRVLIGSSIASTMPGSQAVYDATRSFGRSFALAIRDELTDTGVTVTSLMPGPAESEFPAEVARRGFEALIAGEETAVGGKMAEPQR